MTAGWVPVGDPPPPDDTHTWARPAGLPCPHCECCSALLCQRAILRSTTCEMEGTAGDLPLSMCPCWRPDSAARGAAAQVGRPPAGVEDALPYRVAPPRRRPPVKDIRARLQQEAEAAAAGHALRWLPGIAEEAMVSVCGCGKYRSAPQTMQWARKAWGDHVRCVLRNERRQREAAS